MSARHEQIDWLELADAPRDAGGSSPRRRLRWILAVYVAALVAVLARAIQLEVSDGAAFRALAVAPIERPVVLRADRGRILARDGTVLAHDNQTQSLAVHYRYLQWPPDAAWLRRQARLRLSRAERRNPAAVVAAEEELRQELRALRRRLAALCGVSEAQWNQRTARTAAGVEQLADTVNRRRREQFVEQTSTVNEVESLSLTSILAGLFAPPDALPPADILVAEQNAYHRLIDDLPIEADRAIRGNPATFPGVKVVGNVRREYPRQTLAANILGHVGASAARAMLVDDEAGIETSGLQGAEKLYEAHLRGNHGHGIRVTDRHGEELALRVEQSPATGRDVVLTLDAYLQELAEQLLDRALRTTVPGTSQRPQGGAVLVMHVKSGELLVAASAPRFDPNWFVSGDPRIELVLADSRRPLFDRATRMAIAPGSVFKPLTALAMLEHGVVRAEERFSCRGYLHRPDRMRCQIFRQHGIGHGEITLADALSQSCNVYFFEHARALGADTLLDWSRRLGFGQPIGGELAAMTNGQLPSAAELQSASALESFAIGQSTFTTTPLEVLRMYAAIANGGYLVEPRLTREEPAPANEHAQWESPSAARQYRIAGLDSASLDAVRAGLERAVEDAAGTAFESLRIDGFRVAAKTGTAETGAGQADHAWVAGYAPADAPRVAFVVVLEHGGSGGRAAATIGRQLLQSMRTHGYFGAARTAASPLPPGKG